MSDVGAVLHCGRPLHCKSRREERYLLRFRQALEEGHGALAALGLGVAPAGRPHGHGLQDHLVQGPRDQRRGQLPQVVLQYAYAKSNSGVRARLIETD